MGEKRVITNRKRVVSTFEGNTSRKRLTQAELEHIWNNLEGLSHDNNEEEVGVNSSLSEQSSSGESTVFEDFESNDEEKDVTVEFINLANGAKWREFRERHQQFRFTAGEKVNVAFNTRDAELISYHNLLISNEVIDIMAKKTNESAHTNLSNNIVNPLPPPLTKIRERFLLVPREEYLVDEQIISTKARTQLKQYNPEKPHNWGYKNFVLSGMPGFSYDFNIFTGSQSIVVSSGCPNLGMSSNVLRLSDAIPRNHN
ncbi:hypothetical protein ILUMI_10983, partial [Ignelater luminosus]